ncbi:MAG: serine/threonine protein kinase [Planctomycetota bacterium]|jgi:hypothetical protein
MLKVLDFGVARATDADLNTVTIQTTMGQLVGTVPYMSPEQASGDPGEIDTRSDVYSVGVLGWELLTGRLPYDVRGKMVHEAVRVIREEEAQRLSSIDRSLRGDVETIFEKALEKDRHRRYQSAADFAADIRRHLAHEPISARRASTYYQLRKFARRNKILVGGTIATLLVATVGATVATAFALAATRRAAELQQVVDYQAAQFDGVDAEQMGIRLRRDLLDQARIALASAGLADEEVEAQMAALEGLIDRTSFTDLARRSIDDNFFSTALAAARTQFADQPVVRARLLQSLAVTMRKVGLWEAATEPQAEALAVRRRELGDDHPDTLRSMYDMGMVWSERQMWTEAEPLFREAHLALRRVVGEVHEDTYLAMKQLSYVMWRWGRVEESEAIYREAIAVLEQLKGDDHPEVLEERGGWAYWQGRHDEVVTWWRAALEARRRVHGDTHPYTVNTMCNLAAQLWGQGDLAGAEALYRDVLSIRRPSLGHGHPDTLDTLHALGGVLLGQASYDEAEALYREELLERRRVFGDDHASTVAARDALDTLDERRSQRDRP